MITLYNQDCFDAFANIEDGSVDMVLCDPPYGTMKGIGKTLSHSGGGHGLTRKTEWDTALDFAELFSQYERVLRHNGIIVLFSQEPLTSQLIAKKNDRLPFMYRMIWKKDHFANALISKVAPVNYFEDIVVFHKKYDSMCLHPLRSYSKKLMEVIGLNIKNINKELGHGKAEHFFRHDSTQFALCSEKTYSEIIQKWNLMDDWVLPYQELKVADDEFKKKFKKKFNLPDGRKVTSNVLEFKKDYDGFHPTQKPVALLEHLIRLYTDEGDVVLDNTMGSGSTGVACVRTNRSFIGIEKDPAYYEIAQKRILG